MEEVPQNVMLGVTGMAGALTDYYYRRLYKAIRFDGHPRTGGSFPKSWRGNKHGKTSREYKRRNEISSEPRVPGEIKRSRDLRGGRWSWTLNFAQKRSWVGRWSWAEQVGRLLLRVVQVVRQQRCSGQCLSDCPAQRLKQQLRSVQVTGQWRGDTTLTLPLFWRRSTVSPVFFGRFPRSSLSLSRPLPTLSPSLIGHLASVDVKQHETSSEQRWVTFRDRSG